MARPAVTSVVAASLALGRAGRTPMLSNQRAVPGEPAAPEELVRAVRDERQADGQPEHEQPEVDVVHAVRMARPLG